MNIFVRSNNYNPEIKQALLQREIKIENQINKFRFFILLIFTILDSISLYIYTGINTELIYIIISGILFSSGMFIVLHKLTNDQKYRGYIKYITVSIDFVFILFIVVEFIDKMPALLPINKSEILLFLTIVIIFFNTLSSLRSNRSIVIYSTVIAISVNFLNFYIVEATLLICSYTTAFIILSGIFNLWVSKHIEEHVVANNKLNTALSKLKIANNDIIQRNEKITTQKDEIERQRDFVIKQRDKIAKHEKDITDSIHYARRIQKALFPIELEIKKQLPECFILLKPKDIVSGDFYWFSTLNHNGVELSIIAAVDCTGHGVPGAFMSILGMSYLDEIVNKYNICQANEILNHLRKYIKEALRQTGKEGEAKDGMDIALCVIDKTNMKLQFAGAYNPLIWIRKVSPTLSINCTLDLKTHYKTEIYNNTELLQLKADRMPIGVYIKEKETFTNFEIDINPDDNFYIFSDGFADQIGGIKGEKYKIKRLKKQLCDFYEQSLSMQQQKIELNKTLNNWMQISEENKYQQVDDILFIGFKL